MRCIVGDSYMNIGEYAMALKYYKEVLKLGIREKLPELHRKKYWILSGLLICVFVFKQTIDGSKAVAIDAAIEKSLPVLETGSHTFLKNAAALVNCHNEEKVFQLLGLTWCNGDQRFIAQQARNLIATQHAVGGWSQCHYFS